jgi:hypothetical protein
MRVYGRDIALPLAICFFLYYGSRIRHLLTFSPSVIQTLEADYILYPATTCTPLRCVLMGMTSLQIDCSIEAALPNFFRGGDVVPFES